MSSLQLKALQAKEGELSKIQYSQKNDVDADHLPFKNKSFGIAEELISGGIPRPEISLKLTKK